MSIFGQIYFSIIHQVVTEYKVLIFSKKIKIFNNQLIKTCDVNKRNKPEVRLIGGVQGHSKPHSPWWARVPLSSFCLKSQSIFIFPHTSLIFFLILALQVGDLPTPEGSGYPTGGVIMQNEPDIANT